MDKMKLNKLLFLPITALTIVAPAISLTSCSSADGVKNFKAELIIPAIL